MFPSVKSLDVRWYPEFEPNWDNRLFRELLLRRIDRSKRVLDYGCGRGHVEEMNFRGIAEFVAGVDPDKAAYNNPFLDEARILELPSGKIPYGDASFDVIFADNVMEHVANPLAVFVEIRRVLKPGGVFLAKTPNKWHYMPLIARCTPTWFHKAVNRRRGRLELDTFPTYYRCNSSGDVRSLAARSGLEVRAVSRVEGRPEYLRFNVASYALGRLYERVVNANSVLEPLRCVLTFELSRTR